MSIEEECTCKKCGCEARIPMIVQETKGTRYHAVYEHKVEHLANQLLICSGCKVVVLASRFHELDDWQPQSHAMHWGPTDEED